MSNNLSIGSNVRAAGGGNATTNSGSSSEEIKVSTPSFQSAAAANVINPTQVNTVGELKQAEVRGERTIPGEEFVIKAIEKANKALEGRYTSFEFSVHHKTKQISIKVLDRDTGEVIREIPPEKTLDMVARLWELSGILVDEKR